MKISVLRSAVQPKLKGRAAWIKHIIPVMLYVFEQFMTPH